MIARRPLLLTPLVTAAAGPAPDGLHARAARKGLTFGAALATRHLDEPDFADAFAAECGLAVGEFEQQWERIEAREGVPNWAAADRLAGFAASRGILLRGHALLWHQRVPPWAREMDAPRFRAAVERRVAEAAGRYAGRMSSWDVVNEAVRPDDGRPDGLRDSVLLRQLGPGWVAEAFRLARAADPRATLVYNEFGIEHATRGDRAKRRHLLRLLEAMRAADAPVGALGVQGHLHAHLPFDAAEWRGFLREVEALGLSVLVSELDVNDRALPAEITPRDAAVADLTRRFLDATLDCRAVRAVITWTLSDRHSWIRRGQEAHHRRADGAVPRPLPLDDQLRRKPMWQAIAAAFDHAPNR